MALRIALCLLLASAATSANLLESAEGAVDESVLAFYQGASRAGTLADRLGLHQDVEIAQMGEDLELELGRRIREALRDLLQRIEDHVDNGKGVAKDLIEKVKGLKQKLKDLRGGEGERLKEIREKAKELLKRILKKLGLGKRNLDDSMDQVARLRFRDLEERIREELVSEESIRQLKEYIENFQGESPVVVELARAVRSARDPELRKVALAALQGGGAWDGLQDFFRGLHIKLQGHTRKFGKWVQDVWGRGMDRLRDKHGAIKAIAMEFVANSKDQSSEMAGEALEFFRPYKDDLGALWEQIEGATKEVIGKF